MENEFMQSLMRQIGTASASEAILVLQILAGVKPVEWRELGHGTHFESIPEPPAERGTVPGGSLHGGP